MKPSLKSHTDCLKSRTYVQNAPRIAHRWGNDRAMLRENNEHRRVIRENTEKFAALADLCRTICMVRTSSGKVGVEYPILREKLKQCEEELNGFGNIGWMAIRRHVRHNLKDAYFPIR